VGIIPVQEDLHVRKGRFILPADPHRDVSAEVEKGKVVFMPMAEPYLAYPLLGPDLSDAVLVRGRID
jgi:hypothetical protein